MSLPKAIHRGFVGVVQRTRMGKPIALALRMFTLRKIADHKIRVTGNAARDNARVRNIAAGC